MTSIAGSIPGGNIPVDPATAAKDAKLHKVSKEMEGVFVQQMYKAMRSTVPTDGVFDGGSGEEMFTGLLDERIAADTPQHWKHGLSESIFRQLRDAVRAQGSPLPPESAVVMPSAVDR